MAYEALKQAVTDVITTNGNEEITGAILKALLNDNLIPILGTRKKASVVYDSVNSVININTTNQTVEFPSNFFVAGNIGLVAKASLAALPYTDGYFLNVIYFDFSDNSVGVALYDAAGMINNPERAVLAMFIPSKKTLTTAGFVVTIDGGAYDPEILKKNDVQVVYDKADDYINFNLVTNEIEFPANFFIVGQNRVGSGFKSITGQANLPFTSGYNISVLWFDTVSEEIGVSIHSGTFKTEVQKQVLATILPSRSAVTTNGFRFKKNGVIENALTPYDESAQRLILPDKIFVTNAYSIKLYKEGMTASKLNQDNNLVSLKTTREVSLIEPYLDIDDSLPGTVTIIQTPKTPNGYFYRKDLTVVNTDASSKSGAKSIICLGDSLTNRGIAARTKTKIESISSVTLTPVGTMSNQESAQGEGREGWEFENFIGKDNTHSSGTITRQTTAGASSTTLNPFLKLADAADKANNPTWCFTNTGANLETSYAEDDTLGDYYIFDWDFYFSTQGITPPDVLTIALSTNDLNQTPADWLDNCSLGLEIMLKQLDQYCIDNAINISVGVVPTPAWGNNSNGVTKWAQIVEWCEKALFDINSYAFTNITVDVVAVWMHQDGQASFEEGNSTVGNVSTYSTVNKVGYSEYIHFGTEAKNQYADVLSAFVISKL